MVGERCERGGWRFRSFTHTADLDSSVAFPTESEEQAFLVGELMMSANVARDVADELRREPADVLVADSMLLGALSVGEADRVPTVALFTTAFRSCGLAHSLTRSTPSIGSLEPRAARPSGFDLVSGLSDVHDACSLWRRDIAGGVRNDRCVPPNVRFVGPFLDAPALLRTQDPGLSRGTDGFVVVSFSSAGQRQHEPLQRVVDALGKICRGRCS